MLRFFLKEYAIHLVIVLAIMFFHESTNITLKTASYDALEKYIFHVLVSFQLDCGVLK